MRDFKFQKEGRLVSHKLFERLFAEGRSLAVFPLRFVWMPVTESNVPVQVAFAVSSRHWRRAVDRNKFRRRMRESYRLNHTTLTDYAREANLSLALCCLYIAKEPRTFAQIQHAMIKGLERIPSQIAKHPA